MALATLFLTMQARSAALVGKRAYFLVTALDNAGAIFAGYTGMVHFTSSDPGAILPADYTFVGGDAGVHIFPVTFANVGPQSITAHDAAAVVTNSLINVDVEPNELGWGFDPYAIGPWGSAEAGVGLKLLAAVAVSTNQVDVTLNEEPLNIGPFNPGDVFNPSVWTVQNLTTTAFLHVVDVEAVTTTVYRVTTLEPFPDFHIVLQVGSTTLLDQAGNLITAPRSANFRGILAYAMSTAENQSVDQGTTSRDIKNVPVPGVTGGDLVGGTLVLTGAGDYDTVQGKDLLRKLVLRRIFTTPGDFFHLPDYGVGIKEKGPLPVGQLTKLRKIIINQVSREPELQDVAVALSLANNDILTIQVQASIKPTGQQLDLAFNVPIAGASF
jgi:hypothetical protein